MNRIFAAFMISSVMLFGGMSVFADDPASSLPTEINLSYGSIVVTNRKVTYYLDSGSPVTETEENPTTPLNPNGYIIKGVQTSEHTLTIQNADVPLIIQPDNPSAFTINAPAPNTNTPALSTSAALIVRGPVTVSGTLQAGVLSVDSPSGSLQAEDIFAAQISAAGNIVSSGNITAAQISSTSNISAAGSITASGNGQLEGTISVGADTTFTAGTAITASGNIESKAGSSIRVPKGPLSGAALSLDGLTEAASITSKGTLTASNLTTTGDILSGSDMNLTTANNQLTANSITSGGTLTAYSINVNGPVQSNGQMVLSGAKAGSFQVQSGNLVTEQGTQLTSTGDIRVQNGEIDLNGPTDAAGHIVAYGQISLNGTTRANSITSSNGSIVTTAPVTTTAGNIEAKTDIQFGASVEASGIIEAINGSIANKANTAAIQKASAVRALSGAINLTGGTAVLNDISAKNALVLDGITSCATIRSSEGNVTLRGTANVSGNIEGKTITADTRAQISAAALKAVDTLRLESYVSSNAPILQSSAGDIIIGTNTDVKAHAIQAGRSISIADKASVAAQSLRADNGTISAAANSTLNADSIYPSIANRYDITLLTPFAAGSTIEIRASGISQPFVKTAASNGSVIIQLPSGYYVITAESKGRSYSSSNVTVNQSALTISLIPNNNSSGGGGGNGGHSTGGDSEFDSDAFWADVSDRIYDADAGDTIRVTATKADNVPVWLLKELKGRNVTLILTHNGLKIEINGKNMHDIPNNRIFYLFEDLADLYEEPPASSSKPSTSSSTSQILPPEVTSSSSLPPISQPDVQPTPAPIIPVTPSSSSSTDESSSEEESSSASESSSALESSESEVEPVVNPEPDPPKRSIVPLVVAGLVILLVIAGGTTAFIIYRKKAESYYGADEDDE